MEIVRGRSYKVVVEFPWGERAEVVTDRVERDADGTVRWVSGRDPDGGAYLDPVIRETETWVFGWYQGRCDVTVRVSVVSPGDPES